MKRRFTYVAGVLVLLDVLVLGGFWHVSAPLSLAATLAVPEVESMLAPLYAEPAREDVRLSGEGEVVHGMLLRPTLPRAALVLVRDPADDAAAESLALALARRGVLVLAVTADREAFATAYARRFGVRVHTTSLRDVRQREEPSSPATRAAYAWRVLKFTRTLLTTG